MIGPGLVQVPRLRRGAHVLPHQSQLVRRDLCAEDMARCGQFGRTSHGFTLTDEDKERCRTPYRYALRSPGASSLAWTAFYGKEPLEAFCKAYGLTLIGELREGTSFEVVLPTGSHAFEPLMAGPETVEVVGPVFDEQAAASMFGAEFAAKLYADKPSLAG